MKIPVQLHNIVAISRYLGGKTAGFATSYTDRAGEMTNVLPVTNCGKRLIPSDAMSAIIVAVEVEAVFLSGSLRFYLRK